MSGPACESLIDLTDPAADYAIESCRQQGYRAAGDDVGRRAHTLIAATNGHAESRPGGVIDTLQPRPAALATGPADSLIMQSCSTVRLELNSRRVTIRTEFLKVP